MFLAMNRFNVLLENAAEFEKLSLSHKSHLQDMDGFVWFHMLKGSETEGRILYASHTVLQSDHIYAPHTPAWAKAASCMRAPRVSQASLRSRK